MIQSVVSYVCQDDHALLPSLTVRETLRFAAGLRLPSRMSKAEKHRRAEEVLHKMGLKDCADTLVGGDLVKGISGGEKRRVSIAVQILTEPRVPLLDEPTSGLDAFTANSIMEVLHGLANEGRTIILTTHQARSDLFKTFGNVLLLARGGRQAYAGPAKDMLGYFNALDYRCPQHTNPADFALDLFTVDLRGAQEEVESRKRVSHLVDSWSHVTEQPQCVEEPLPPQREIDEAEKVDIGPSQPFPGRFDRSSDAPIDQDMPPILVPRSSRSHHKTTLATPAELGALVCTCCHRVGVQTSRVVAAAVGKNSVE